MLSKFVKGMIKKAVQIDTSVLDFEIKTKINSDVLDAEVITACKKKDDTFYFYLLLDGVVIARSGWVENNCTSWKVTKRGNYTVQAHLKRDGVNEHKFSVPRFYKCKADDDLFSSFSSKVVDEAAFEIDFYKKEYPYKDFAIVLDDIKESALLKLSKSGDFHCKKICDLKDKSVVMVTEELSEKSYLFSGSAKCNGRLIFGEEDIAGLDDVSEISDAIGNFSMVNFDGDNVTVKADYFGVSKLYYYSVGGKFVVSNSYHMLLVILKTLEFKLTINKSKVLANLSFVSLQPFYQNFSREMEVNGILCMEPSHYILIDKRGVRFERTGLHNTFDVNEDITAEEYSKLLNEAKDEIIENVNIALKHQKFNNLVLDLSGGLDARMVYSALTNIPSAKDKVRINSLDQPQEPDDIKPALAVNNCYQFSFDDLPVVLKPLLPKKIINNIYSHYLGTYYSYRLPQAHRKIESTIRLSGMYGEIMARPYYSRAYLNTNIDADSTNELVELYVDKYRGRAILGADESAMNAVKEVFGKELSLLPGKSPIEKFDLHYLYYRGSLHCNDAWRTDISIPEWGPLQSKHLFKLKMKTFNKFKSIRLQLDMMNALNPILAAIKYGNESYNRDKELLNDELYYASPIYKDVSIAEDYDNSRWVEANKLKEDRKSSQIESEEFYKEWKRAHAEIDVSEISVNALGYIFKKGILQRDTVMKIFFWILTNKGSQRLEYLSNKLVSLAIQLKLSS